MLKVVLLLKKIELNSYLINNNGCVEVKVNSILFMDYMKESLKKWWDEPESYLLGVISGLIDSDGNIGNGEIVITNKNKSILKKVKEIINKKNIHTKLWIKQNKGKEDKWKFNIYKLRIGTALKNLDHCSLKVKFLNSGDSAATNRH